MKNRIIFSIIIAFVFTAVQSTFAQEKYSQVYNPMRGFVHEVERPLREELSLNGRWDFMPVYETDISHFEKPTTFSWDSTKIKIPSPWNVNSFAEGGGGDF